MQGLDGLWKEIKVRALSGSDSDRALTSEAECSKVPVLMRDELVSLHPVLRTWMLRWSVTLTDPRTPDIGAWWVAGFPCGVPVFARVVGEVASPA
jgi:hypothetical protein